MEDKKNMIVIDPPVNDLEKIKSDFTIIDVPSNGSCLFTAVLESLSINNSLDASHRLRMAICDGIKDGIVDNDTLMAQLGVLGYTKEEYVQRMRHDNCWGTNIELSAISKMFGVEIEIKSYDYLTKEYLGNVSIGYGNAKIFLLFKTRGNRKNPESCEGNHYNGMVPYRSEMMGNESYVNEVRSRMLIAMENKKERNERIEDNLLKYCVDESMKLEEEKEIYKNKDKINEEVKENIQLNNMNNISVSFDNREPLLENITPQGCNNNKAIKLKDLKAGDKLSLNQFTKEEVYSADNECLFKSLCLLINTETNLRNAMRLKIVEEELKVSKDIYEEKDLKEEKLRLEKMKKPGISGTKKEIQGFCNWTKFQIVLLNEDGIIQSIFYPHRGKKICITYLLVSSDNKHIEPLRPKDKSWYEGFDSYTRACKKFCEEIILYMDGTEVILNDNNSIDDDSSIGNDPPIVVKDDVKKCY